MLKPISLLVALALAAGCSARADAAPQAPADAAQKDGPAPNQPPEAPKEYQLSAVVDPGKLGVGQSGRFALTITPQDPWVLKVETPFEVVLTPSAGMKVEKNKLTGKDFVDPKAPAKSVSTQVTASAVGEQSVTADVTFFLCTPEICKRQRTNVAVKVAVQ